MSHAAVAAPDAEVRAGLETPRAAEAAALAAEPVAPAYHIATKSPVVVPPFGTESKNEMNY
ncbi:hypothetical protein [Pseudarthrobacter sp. Y6]|uniref:hypothetical protein n=1 Tax=Pseudarthrobacter sp. Y6 TaxID=3418422 RepID=UPI003CE91499